MAERDKDFYDRLEKAGFWHDWGDDGSGLFMKYLRRGSGYYIDVGAADLVANGDVKLVHGQVDHLTEDAVVLADGTELPADVVVFATGYNSMNGWVADLIDQETADRLGKCWGLGSDTTKDPGPWEGEQRNMWKPTQVTNLWMHGGNLHQSRHYSLYLALQLKARYEGLDDAGVRPAGGAPHGVKPLGDRFAQVAKPAWTWSWWVSSLNHCGAGPEEVGAADVVGARRGNGVHVVLDQAPRRPRVDDGVAVDRPGVERATLRVVAEPGGPEDVQRVARADAR